VALDLETARGEGGEVGRAGIDIEDAVADATAKMVMMALPGDFVPARRAWQLNFGETLLLDQRFEVAIDRGDAQAGHRCLGNGQGLSRRQRPVGMLESLADRGALLSLSSHGAILVRSSLRTAARPHGGAYFRRMPENGRSHAPA